MLWAACHGVLGLCIPLSGVGTLEQVPSSNAATSGHSSCLVKCKNCAGSDLQNH